jgi:nickel-dependent lactate racemase
METMQAEMIRLPWGEDELRFSLPATWTLAGYMSPASITGADDVGQETHRSLQAPIGMPGLASIAKGVNKIVIVIDDDSRPTPVSRMIPPIFEELAAGGIARDQVTVVTALGLHREMRQEEIARRLGTAWEPGLRCENHHCDDPMRLVELGITKRGTPVFINRTVAEADLIISLGCIEPHVIASYGGGYKNLVPGVAGRATIARNHSLNCRPQTFNNVGQPIAHNPMRLDLEEAAGMIKARVFIVNAVLNADLEVVRVVSGHPLEAHRQGCQVSAQIYGVIIPGMADVVITNSFPMDHDLRQGVKALANTVRAVRPGGVMITMIRAEDGVGVFGLANRKLPIGRKALRLLSPLLLPLVPKLPLKNLGEEDRFFLYFALQAMRRSTLLAVAPTIPDEIKERLPFVTFLEDLPTAMEVARRKFPHKAQVLVFPNGGSTYPILPHRS